MKSILRKNLNVLIYILIVSVLVRCGPPPPPLAQDNYILDFQLDNFTRDPFQQTIDGINTITLYLEPDTDLRALEPIIEISPKAEISDYPGTYDFYNDVYFTVTAENGDQREYKIITYLEPTYEFADVGGHDLEYSTLGSGNHTILFDNGLGDTMDSWMASPIFTRLSKDCQVILYNRGGMGMSDVGPTPRNITQLNAEVAGLIDEVSENDKVVFVSHSIAGAYNRAFAIENPDKVLGILFSDPSHEKNPESFTQEQEDWVVENQITIGGKNEAMQLIENREYLSALGNLPDIPITIMTASEPVDFFNYRWELHSSLSEGISENNFKHIRVEADHRIFEDNWQIYIDEINNLLEKL